MTTIAIYPCLCEWCDHRWEAAELNPMLCPRCGSMGETETEEGRQVEAERRREESR